MDLHKRNILSIDYFKWHMQALKSFGTGKFDWSQKCVLQYLHLAALMSHFGCMLGVLRRRYSLKSSLLRQESAKVLGCRMHGCRNDVGLRFFSPKLCFNTSIFALLTLLCRLWILISLPFHYFMSLLEKNYPVLFLELYFSIVFTSWKFTFPHNEVADQFSHYDSSNLLSPVRSKIWPLLTFVSNSSDGSVELLAVSLWWNYDQLAAFRHRSGYFDCPSQEFTAVWLSQIDSVTHFPNIIRNIFKIKQIDRVKNYVIS